MTTLTEIWSPGEIDPLPKFVPSARYIAAMDCLIYLQEDCSYRAIRINTHTTVLLHPSEDRPIGVKLKGMRHLYEKLRTILRELKADVPMPINSLIAFWELAYIDSWDETIETAEKERRRQFAARAKKEIVDLAAPIEAGELDLATSH